MRSSTHRELTFGICPGSALGDAVGDAVGDEELAGPPGRPDRISQALDQLHGVAVCPLAKRN